MIAAQYQFMPTMLQGPEYDCSSVMPYGQAWADLYGVKQLPFGTYSIVFGIITEILYMPCAIGLRKDTKTSCYKIMFWLSILDMVAIAANSILFGVLLLEGAVYCSNPAMTLGVGIVGYGIWFAASACCLLLGVNRLLEILDLSRYFTSKRTNVYLLICCSYGLFMMLFTRPVIVNSTHQSMFFSPFIPEHGFEEYVNLPHAVHNIGVALLSCLLYLTLSIVLVVKSLSASFQSSNSHIINNMPVFIQVMLICGANLIATLMQIRLHELLSRSSSFDCCWSSLLAAHSRSSSIHLSLAEQIHQKNSTSVRGIRLAAGAKKSNECLFLYDMLN